MLMMIDQKPAFEIYHDPEPLELVSSAPQESPASIRSPHSPQTSHQQQHSSLASSLATSVSRISPSPAGSFLADVPRVVLGELSVKTTVNPFHRQHCHRYGSYGGRRLRPTTCDSRLKHETKLRSSSPPRPNASEDSSEDLDGQGDDDDDDDHKDCHGRQVASRTPSSLKSTSSRRSTISTTHIPQNGQCVVVRQCLRKTSLPSSTLGTRSGIMMKHRLPVPSRSVSENISSLSSSSTGFSSSSSRPSSPSSSDDYKHCPQLQVEEETKENLPLSTTRKHGQGRFKKSHCHHQAGVPCQNFLMTRNSSYSANQFHGRQFSLPSSAHLAATRSICSARPSNVAREDRLQALGDSASTHGSPSSSPLADPQVPHPSPLPSSRDPSGDVNPSSVASVPPDPLEDRQLHHRNRSLPSFLMRI